MKTIKTAKGVFEIEIKVDNAKRLVYINASTNPRGTGLYYRLNTGMVKTLLQENNIDFGKAVSKTTVHNGSDDPNTLSGTWVFRLHDPAREQIARARKKPTKAKAKTTKRSTK
tara:strand:+ start:858 stop:1196 length:339 start_codon:yes stop_codon:yes gene_type:complete